MNVRYRDNLSQIERDPSGAAFRIVQRPEYRRLAARYRRHLCRSAGPRHRIWANPGARSHPAGPAGEEASTRHHDFVPQAARHDHAVCRPQRVRRHRHRPQHEVSSKSGPHSFPQRPLALRCRTARLQGIIRGKPIHGPRRKFTLGRPRAQYDAANNPRARERSDIFLHKRHRLDLLGLCRSFLSATHLRIQSNDYPAAVGTF